MHTLNDIIIFLNFYKENKIKIDKEHFLEAVSCVKSYEEFKIILASFKAAGLKTGVRFYDYIVNYICSYDDCREILDFLIKNAAKVNRMYFIQLILLSSSKEDARRIYNEANNQNTRTKLAEIWIERFGDKKQVMEDFHKKAKLEYKLRGYRFIDRVNEIKKIIGALPLDELKRRAMKTTAKRNKLPLLKTEYVRDEYVKRFALTVADGVCQLCEKPAPFLNKFGEPFLEVHHIEYLSQGGSDSIDNVVALCPNCHRQIHVLQNPADVEFIKNKAQLNLSI
jgi:5-methylcytosine-specific restriction endonuclease McrA